MPAVRPMRLFSACLFLLLALAVVLPGAAALAASPARQALETSISRILASIKNPDYVNPTTRGPLRQQIEDEVLHIFDFGEFSSRTVGPRWRTFSPDQQRRFSDAFAELLINTYLNKIDGYNGEQVLYTGETRFARRPARGSADPYHHEGRQKGARGLPHAAQTRLLVCLRRAYRKSQFGQKLPHPVSGHPEQR